MNGFINLDKAAGVSSAHEVAIIKHLTHTRCGHMGTLDPMAGGVLPIAVGNACRLFGYFLEKRKRYVATFRFGKYYDTLDTTGNVLAEGGRIPCEGEIEEVISGLVGEIMQIPPKYSAKSVGGRRGYELARKGIEFTLPPKKVVIYSIKLLGKSGVDSFDFDICCGGGTYIRSIARDMSSELGTYAAMSALKRTQSGPFEIGGAVRSEALTEENISSYLVPVQDVLPYDDYVAEGDTAKKLFNGVAVKCDLSDGVYKIYNAESFYGLADVEGGYMKVKTKLC